MDIQINSLDFNTIKLIDETGQYVEIDLQEELGINESNLDVAMREQPAKYVYWSSILEKIRMFKENADLELEFLEGTLDKEAREELPKLDMKPTKDSVEGYMRRTESYKVAREKCVYYEYLVRRLVFIVKAFEQRSSMLQSYGKQLSDERHLGNKAGRYQEKDNTYG